MNLTHQLADERRRRLEAERLLKQREAELRSANSRLAKHSVTLSVELDETRAESMAVQDKAKELETGIAQVKTDLEKATVAAEEAEQKLWAALQAMRDGFALFDARLRLILANDSYLAIFDGLDDVRPGCHYDTIAQLMLEEGIVDPQGPPDEWFKKMTARPQKSPIPDLTLRLWNGQFVKMVERRTPDGGIVLLGIDQTEAMRMWAAVETVPDGFVIYDQDDRLIMCNQRYREIYPESAEVIKTGVTFEEILRYGLKRGQYAEAEGREDAWLEERLAAHRSVKPVFFEQHLGNGRWLRVLEGPTPDGGRVGLRVDITSLKEHQADLERERERAEAANRAKSTFLANMSHEIRTPMNGVVGMSDLLRETDLDDDQQLYVNTIKSSGEALLVILNDVLDYSKIEAGRMTLHEAPIDLESCLHDIVVLMQPKAHQKAIDLVVDFDMFMPTEFIADSGRIKQIVTNLVGNAVKFTQNGSITIRVTGLGDEDDSAVQHVHLTVEDTGIGIAPDKLGHVFGKFNQVEEDQNRTFEGTGLGLAITRELVELMGGTIWVDSEVGVGSCFGVSLPLRMCGGAPADLPADPPPGLTRAVVIEEDNAARSILLKQLVALGLETAVFDPAAAPEPGSFGPTDVGFVAFTPGAACTEAWIAALRQGGVERVFLVSRAAVRSPSVSVPTDGVEAALAHPIKRSALAAALHRSDVRSAQKEARNARAAPTKTRLRLLAAEDNRTNRLVFERLIADQNVDLTFATNGAEAVAAFEATDAPPDVIFMDISMPEMDGKEATRRIRDIEAQRGLAHTPIIAMTAHALAGDAEEILGAGLDDYLTKPMSKALIAERLDGVRAGMTGQAAATHAAE